MIWLKRVSALGPGAPDISLKCKCSPEHCRLLQAFYTDFARVADDESRHFGWCQQRLKELGFSYGCMVAHSILWDGAMASAGLWPLLAAWCLLRWSHAHIGPDLGLKSMSCCPCCRQHAPWQSLNFCRAPEERCHTSAGDLPGRLAVVPMSQEARGLDAGPRLQGRLVGWGDNRSAAIVGRIAAEERAHVAVGQQKLLLHPVLPQCAACHLPLKLHSCSPGASRRLKFTLRQLPGLYSCWDRSDPTAPSWGCALCKGHGMLPVKWHAVAQQSSGLHSQRACGLAAADVTAAMAAVGIAAITGWRRLDLPLSVAGVTWFKHICAALGQEPGQAYQKSLLQLGQEEALRPPYNDSARAEVGLQRHWYDRDFWCLPGPTAQQQPDTMPLEQLRQRLAAVLAVEGEAAL